MSKPKCDFCSDPAVWDGQYEGGTWAYACKRHDWLLSNKRRLPLQGNKNRGREAAVEIEWEDIDTPRALCPCGRKQLVEPDATEGYCMDCGMHLRFEEPITQLMENPEAFEGLL